MIIKLGSPLPNVSGHGEGAIFHADENGYILVYNFDRPTQDEIAQMHEGCPFEIAYTVIGGAIWILSRCGTLEWADAPFHPALSPRWDRLPAPAGTEGHALTLIMTDATDTTVKSLRVIGLGHGFSVKLREEIRSLAQKSFDPEEYGRSINNTLAAYSTKKLLSMASEKWRLK